MKLQHLAIIFVIIILPISLVISAYMQTQIDTINLQTTYNTKLQTATYDAIKAFQLNTLNNKYSTVSDSKIRDIEASISTFYNSLGTELGASGYNTESLQQFIPAIVYTLYDGYYIYGKYYNENTSQYQYGLKPYIYYSCRYQKGTNYDFVVNYTLDNYITVYGKINGEYVTKSGPLINPILINEPKEKQYKYKDINNNEHIYKYVTHIKYDGVEIEPEILKEQLIFLDDNNYPNKKEYEYVTYNNQKVYYEGGEKYFWYKDNKKQYITDVETLQFVINMTEGGHLYSNSAAQYYYNAYEFSKWVNDNLSSIRQSDAVDEDGKQITDFAIKTTDEEKIFELSKDNNPLLDSSTFNQNRISVIRRVIQSTLNTAIANYSSSAEYEFAMPIFTEEDWDRLENNISVATFMQGIPIGTKYYNNYCIITNNKNKEYVSKDSIYVITQDNEAHLAASKDVIDNNKVVIEAYKNIDFELQTVVAEEKENYYYPHANDRCYSCIVNEAETYNIDDIIAGEEVKGYNKNTDEFDIKINKDISNLRKVYLTALAREKYGLLWGRF